MATLGAGYTFGATEQVTNTKLGLLVSSGTVTGIVNADIDSGAAIANSKLNLASITQAVAMTGGLTLTTNGASMPSCVVNGTITATGGVVNGNLTASACTLNQVVASGTITTNSNYVVEGYSTGRNVLRKSMISLVAGGTPGTNITCTNNTSNGQGFNSPTITTGTNLAKNAAAGSFALNTAGDTLTVTISPTAVAVIGLSLSGHRVINGSTAAGNFFYPRAIVSAGNILMRFSRTANTAELDITGILTSASDELDVELCYLTST